MKTSSKLLILAILCTVCLVLIACGKIDSIYFETEPRKTYVQGQEFTLDNAVINAIKGNESTPVDNSEVTVSGYNKDLIGEQTVTVTYGEHSLTLKVTVIPRITLEGITREYFVGDSFNKENGRLRVADDQGNVKSVNMNDAAVTVEGFSSDTAGAKTITVKYGDYTGTATVNVYAAETVELTSKPKKTVYYSHDTEFSITGAFFTVTANNGSLTRMIEATPDMVTGFKEAINSATIENMDTPLAQTVKFNYLGKSFDFKITVRFSGVSLAQLRSEELKDVTPETATEEQNEKALDALRVYADMTPSDQKLVSDEAIQKLLEIGVTYGAEVFAAEAEAFAETFTLKAIKDSETKRTNSKITIIATSYEAVKRDLERLEDIDVPLLELAATLYELKEEFYFKKIGDKTVDEILGTVFEPDAIDEVTQAFSLLVELYDTLEPVPDDWKTSDPTLTGYENEIRAAVAIINASDFKAYENSTSIYSILSTWRKENDYFDIIYSFYYDNDKANLTSTLWEKVHLPGLLQDLYVMNNFACQEAIKLRVGDDTSTFMYYYYRANEIAERIKSSGSDLHIKIYNYLNFDRLIRDYLFFGTANFTGTELNGIAYVYHASSLLGNETYEKLLDDFFELFKLSLQDGFSFENEDVQKLAKTMLDTYASFTPNERFAFLSSLHCDYRISTSNQLVLNHTVDEDGILTCFNYFTFLLYSSYREVLSAEAYDVFTRLMEASEMYSLRYHNPNLFNGFTDGNGVEHLGFMATMAKIIEDAAKLNDSDKELFASLLAEMTKVYGYELETPSAPTLSTEQNALFDELKTAIENFYFFYNKAISEDVDAADKFQYYAIAFSAFERAKALAAELRALDNADVLYTLLYVPTSFKISLDTDVSASATYDYMLDGIGSVFYLTTLRTETANGSNVCTIYWNNNLSSFMNQAYDIFLAVFNNTLDETYVEKIKALDNAFNDHLFTYKQIEDLKQLGIYEYYEAAIKFLESQTAA